MDYKEKDKTLGMFKSKARTTLLLNFFVNPEKEFYTRELEKKFDIPVGNVRRELKKIEASGLIAPRRLGNLVLYKVDKSNPFYFQLKDFIIKNIGIHEFIRPYFEKEKDIAFSLIYGSYARGEFDVNSDIDIFIVTKKNNSFYEKLNSKISGFEKIFGREFNTDFMTLGEYSKKKRGLDPYINDIIKNQKVFIKGGESDI